MVVYLSFDNSIFLPHNHIQFTVLQQICLHFLFLLTASKMQNTATTCKWCVVKPNKKMFKAFFVSVSVSGKYYLMPISAEVKKILLLVKEWLAVIICFSNA